MGIIERTVKVIACGINSSVQREYREGRVRSLFRESSLLICAGDTEEVWISANTFHVPRVNIQQHKAKYTQQPAFFIFSRAALLTDHPLMTAEGHRARQQQRRLFPAVRRLKENASGENGIYSYFLSLLSLWYRRQPLENVIIAQHGKNKSFKSSGCVFTIEMIGLTQEWELR